MECQGSLHRTFVFPSASVTLGIRPACAVTLYAGFLYPLSRPSGNPAIFSGLCRPSQTARHDVSALRALADETIAAGVTLSATRRTGTLQIRHLPATLCVNVSAASRSCREIVKGLLFPTELASLFSCACDFNGLQVGTVSPSLIRSCRTPIKRLGISLP